MFVMYRVCVCNVHCVCVCQLDYRCEQKPHPLSAMLL